MQCLVYSCVIRSLWFVNLIFCLQIILSSIIKWKWRWIIPSLQVCYIFLSNSKYLVGLDFLDYWIFNATNFCVKIFFMNCLKESIQFFMCSLRWQNSRFLVTNFFQLSMLILRIFRILPFSLSYWKIDVSPNFVISIVLIFNLHSEKKEQKSVFENQIIIFW